MTYLSRHSWQIAQALALHGYGWEDICHRLRLTSDLDRGEIRRMVLGVHVPATQRDVTGPAGLRGCPPASFDRRK